MKVLLRIILYPLLFLVIFVVSSFIYYWYVSKELSGFCSSATGFQRSDVDEKIENYKFEKFQKHENELVLLNHSSPFFRMGCKLTFQDNKVVEAEYFGAD